MSGDHVHVAAGAGAGAGAPALAGELPESVDIYDTTLRDGSQQEGLSLTVDDKLRVAEQLDHLGVQYIEGGWPGAHGHAGRFRVDAEGGRSGRDGSRAAASPGCVDTRGLPGRQVS